MEKIKSLNLANLVQLCITDKAHLSGKVVHTRLFLLALFSDTFLSNHFIELYSQCDHIASARHVFDNIPHKNIFSWNAILAAYCKARSFQHACCLFLQMPQRNTNSLNTLISTMVRCGYGRQALDTYDSVMLDGVKPSHITFATVFSACGSLCDADCGRRNHGVVVKVGLQSNIYVVNALLYMYAKCRLNADALRVFRDIPEPNEVTFTTMMGGLAQTNQVKEAPELFRLMLRKGIRVDSVSLSSILGVCAKGERDVVKLGFERDLHLCNSLLDMYAKIGDMDSAEKVFVNLNLHSVVSWNIMIAGYGNRCNSEKAAEYLQRMQCDGYEPDDVTYVNMLTACVKSGDVRTGRQIFDCMPCPSLTLWNALLSGYNQKADHREEV
uniref:Pentacotripeptide-repeat region of PRORP domain-containing protein n=1 Tax=Glycine max TaxID=3847 RepID=A0A0R0HAE9_SOYBN